MTTQTATILALIAAFSATPVLAADLTTYSDPPAYSAPSSAAPAGWTGPYVGIHGGMASDTLNPFSGDKDLALGVQAGYNAELGGAIVGGEVELSHMGDTAVDVPGGSLHERHRVAAKARAGGAIGETLVYGTVGLAMTNLRDGPGTAGPDGWKPGVLLGAGAEQQLTDNISARAEYNYVRTNEVRSFNGTTTSQSDITDHTIKLGLNYRF